MNRTTIVIVTAKVTLGAALALGFLAAPHGTAHADTPTVTIEEDSPQWDCRYDGNRICGVGATLPDGSAAVPGDYSDDNCWPGVIYFSAVGSPVEVATGVEIS